MPESPFQQQFRSFLEKAGEELKRTGELLKTEAQRAVEQVKDPANQQKIRDGLKDLSVWAKKTSDQAADLIDKAAKKAEDAWKKNVGREEPPAAKPPPAKAPTPAPAETRRETSETPRATQKTVGKRKTGSKPTPRAGGKTVGKKSK